MLFPVRDVIGVIRWRRRRWRCVEWDRVMIRRVRIVRRITDRRRIKRIRRRRVVRRVYRGGKFPLVQSTFLKVRVVRRV